MTTFAIVGGGVAGVTAARSLADAASTTDEIHIFGAELYPYCPRPDLWRFIAGEMEQEDLTFQPLSWHEQRGIQFHLNTRVAAVEADEHHLTLSNGERVTYDRSLFATGGRPFVPPVEGTDREGVLPLRTLEDVGVFRIERTLSHREVSTGSLSWTTGL